MSYGKFAAWVVPPIIVVLVMIALHSLFGRGIDPERINAEYEYWKDWATTLIIVMTVLLAFNGSLLGDDSNRSLVLLGGVIGFVGVLLVAVWFTREGFWEFTGNFLPFKDKPVLLLCGSGLFGMQAIFFLFAFVLRQLSRKTE